MDFGVQGVQTAVSDILNLNIHKPKITLKTDLLKLREIPKNIYRDIKKVALSQFTPCRTPLPPKVCKIVQTVTIHRKYLKGVRNNRVGSVIIHPCIPAMWAGDSGPARASHTQFAFDFVHYKTE